MATWPAPRRADRRFKLAAVNDDRREIERLREENAGLLVQNRKLLNIIQVQRRKLARRPKDARSQKPMTPADVLRIFAPLPEVEAPALRDFMD